MSSWITQPKSFMYFNLVIVTISVISVLTGTVELNYLTFVAVFLLILLFLYANVYIMAHSPDIEREKLALYGPSHKKDTRIMLTSAFIIAGMLALATFWQDALGRFDVQVIAVLISTLSTMLVFVLGKELSTEAAKKKNLLFWNGISAIGMFVCAVLWLSLSEVDIEFFIKLAEFTVSLSTAIILYLALSYLEKKIYKPITERD